MSSEQNKKELGYKSVITEETRERALKVLDDFLEISNSLSENIGGLLEKDFRTFGEELNTYASIQLVIVLRVMTDMLPLCNHMRFALEDLDKETIEEMASPLTVEQFNDKILHLLMMKMILDI